MGIISTKITSAAQTEVAQQLILTLERLAQFLRCRLHA